MTRLVFVAVFLFATVAHAQSAAPPPSSAPPSITLTAEEQAMAPESHLQGIYNALDRSQCEEDVDCRDLDAAVRHLEAIVRLPQNREFLRAHRQEMQDLLAQIQRANQEQREAAASRRAALQSAGPAPTPDERGGNYREVRRFLATRLDNPRSYQPVRCETPSTDGAGWHVTCSFRARNRFNALVLQSWTFLFNRGHVVDGGPDEIIHH